MSRAPKIQTSSKSASERKRSGSKFKIIKQILPTLKVGIKSIILTTRLILSLAQAGKARGPPQRKTSPSTRAWGRI
jgi:hypothetical protein